MSSEDVEMRTLRRFIYSREHGGSGYSDGSHELLRSYRSTENNCSRMQLAVV